MSYFYDPSTASILVCPSIAWEPRDGAAARARNIYIDLSAHAHAMPARAQFAFNDDAPRAGRGTRPGAIATTRRRTDPVFGAVPSLTGNGKLTGRVLVGDADDAAALAWGLRGV